MIARRFWVGMRRGYWEFRANSPRRHGDTEKADFTAETQRRGEEGTFTAEMKLVKRIVLDYEVGRFNCFDAGRLLGIPGIESLPTYCPVHTRTKIPGGAAD